MTNNAEGDRAMAAVNGQEVGGRALNVNEAKPKSEGGSRASAVVVEVAVLEEEAVTNLIYTSPFWTHLDRGREATLWPQPPNLR